MRISDWSSDVCSSDLMVLLRRLTRQALSHRSKRRLFAAQALDMRIIEHRSDPLKDAPGRFRDCEPARPESIHDQQAGNLIDLSTTSRWDVMSLEHCSTGTAMSPVLTDSAMCRTSVSDAGCFMVGCVIVQNI